MHSFDFRHYTAVDSTFDLKKKDVVNYYRLLLLYFFSLPNIRMEMFLYIRETPRGPWAFCWRPDVCREEGARAWMATLWTVNSVSTLLFKRHYYITTHSSWKKKTLTLLLQLCLVVDVVMNANMNISKVWLKRLGDLWYFECKHCHVKAIATDDSIIVFLYIKNNVNFNHRSCDKFGEFKKKFN